MLYIYAAAESVAVFDFYITVVIFPRFLTHKKLYGAINDLSISLFKIEVERKKNITPQISVFYPSNIADPHLKNASFPRENESNLHETIQASAAVAA